LKDFAPDKRETNPFLAQPKKRTMILYVSPHKLVKLYRIHYHFGEERPICVCRELSNYIEENVRGTVRSFDSF
jgi:16S rRNA (cytidine1402-2'-O)-methyltransferase